MASPLIKITIILNSILGLADRILQICYYALTKKNNLFLISTADHISLTCILLPLAFHFIIIFTFVLFHYEQGLTCCTKIKSFFIYLLSSELLIPLGIQYSLKTKYSEYADNPLVTMKLINAVHIIFVSIPQILIISVNSSANNNFENIDITSIFFSSFFIVWSGIYYLLCGKFEIDYDDYITLTIYKNNKIL